MDSDASSAICRAEQAIRDYHDTDNEPRTCLKEALKEFQLALDHPDSPTLSLASLVGLSRTYCYLAGIEEATCIEHAHRAVEYAERAHEMHQGSSSLSNNLVLAAQIQDALGCALQRRYTCSGSEEDCIRAIEAGTIALEYTDFRVAPSVKAVRQYHLATTYYVLARRPSALMLGQEDWSYFTEAARLISSAVDLAGGQNTKYLLLYCKIWSLHAENYGVAIYFKSNLAPMRTAPGGNHPVPSAGSGTESDFNHVSRDFIDEVSKVTCGYIQVFSSGKSSYMRVAGRLGFFGACLVAYTQRPDESDSFYACGRDLFKTMQDESFEIDLRHATLLRDILTALVRCKCGLNMQMTGLIEVVARRLDVLLPQSHVERPDLHYLLGMSLNNDQLKRLTLGDRKHNWLPIIEQYRAALKSTPDGHPSQLQYLSALAVRLRASGLSGASTDQARILFQEARCWEGVIQALDSHREEMSDVEGFLNTAADETIEAIRAGGYLSATAFKGMLGLLRRHFGPLKKYGKRALNDLQAASTLDGISIILHGYHSISRSAEYVDEAVEIWQLARTHPTNAHITQKLLDFGLGSALSYQGSLKLKLGSKDANEIYRLHTDGIMYMQRALATADQMPMTPQDIRKWTILGDAFAYRHEANVWLHGIHEDIEKAIEIYRNMAAQAISLELSPGTIRFIAKSWVEHATTLSHDSAVEAYGLSISSSARSAWVGMDIQARCDGIRLSDHRYVVAGIACACQCGMLDQAVEFLETGCSILFSLTMPLRNRHPDLYAKEPELALELEQLGRAIHERSFQNDCETLLDKEDDGSTTRADQIIKQGYELRCLGHQWEDLLSRVRSIEGCENFAQTPPLEELCRAAARGPVVIVVSSQSYDTCYAIVLPHPAVDAIQCTKLPLSATDAQKFSHEFNELLVQRALRMRSGSDDDARGLILRTTSAEKPEEKAHKILAQIWHLVMKPTIDLVYQSLDLNDKDHPLPHVWIRATGALSSLPLHAAGEYQPNGKPINGQCVLDRIICSYTPSLSALLREPPSSNTPSKVSIVSGGQGLSHTSEEAQIAHMACGRKATVELLHESGEKATGSRVREMIRDAHIAHFACHGVQDPVDPLKSRLLFSETSQIELEELMREPLPNARLAVLLACETAQGDKQLKEETLHIAGTMLFAGFRSSVGSLWRMADIDGPKICDDFYNTLLEGDNGTIDYDRVGLALHTAVCKLRDSGVGVFRWATFVHIGQ